MAGTVADATISQLEPATQANATDKLETSQAGASSTGYVTRSITLDQVATLVAESAQIQAEIDGAIPSTPEEIALWPFVNIAGDTMTGDLHAGSVTNQTIVYAGAWIDLIADNANWAGINLWQDVNAANQKSWMLRTGSTGYGRAGAFHIETTDDAYTVQHQWSFNRDGSTTLPGDLFVGDNVGTWEGVALEAAGWVSAWSDNTGYPAFSLHKTNNPANQQQWQITLSPSGALESSALDDGWTPQHTWTYGRDGSTTLPGPLTGTTATFSAAPAYPNDSTSVATTAFVMDAVAAGGGGGGGAAEFPITGGDPVDTGLSRISAGVVGVGNGTAGNISGALHATLLSGPVMPAMFSLDTITTSNVVVGGGILAMINGADTAYLLEFAAQRKAIMGSTSVQAWSSSESAGASVLRANVDTGLSRISAGVVGVGNGTVGNASGTLTAAKATMGGITFGGDLSSTTPGFFGDGSDSIAIRGYAYGGGRGIYLQGLAGETYASFKNTGATITVPLVGTSAEFSGNVNAALFIGSGTFYNGGGYITGLNGNSFLLRDTTATTGVVLRLDTDATLKVRNRANSADAAITAGTANLTGALTGTTATFSSLRGYVAAPGAQTTTLQLFNDAFTAGTAAAMSLDPSAGGVGSRDAQIIGYWTAGVGVGTRIRHYTGGVGATVLDIDNAGAVTLSGALTGTTATFSGNVASTVVSATPPASPLDRQLWFNSDASPGGGQLMLRYNDGTGASQWVPASPGVGSGSVVQTVSFQTGALATGTTAIPFDDTIPQISEGNEFMTLAITPKSATSKLVIEVTAYLSNSVAGSSLCGALFQDSTVNALAAGYYTMPNATLANLPGQVSFTHTMTSGSTSATTFRFRAGGNVASTTTFNGNSGARTYGGVMASSIVIQEVL